MNSPSNPLTRRDLLCGGAAAAAAAAAGEAAARGGEKNPQPASGERAVSKGRIRQSAVSWCYEPMPVETLARHAAALGLAALENVPPKQWDILKRYGLVNAMTVGHGFVDGMNHKENHAMCVAKLNACIDDNAAAGFPNVITFSGNRAGMDDQEGLANCIAGLKKIAGYAEKKKVTICLEFLNSHNHKDYMADSTKWNVGLVHGVGSPRVKVLYDIYHAGMMKEDIIADVKEHHDCWGHFHTGGVPGRHEINDTQTLDYAKIAKAIVDTGYRGYIGQEFTPTRKDALTSLEEAIQICDA
jgi:hydroxypyruvate isomerase